MADLIIYGGTIHSMDDNYPCPEAVAISGHKIIAVGDKETIMKDCCKKNTSLIELEGDQTLMPGFIEAHSHPTSAAFSSVIFTSCSGYDYSTKEEIDNLFTETVANIEPGSGHWCLFFGWDPEIIRDLPTLNFDTLDGYSTETPIFVTAQNGHTAWANRKAFEVSGIGEDVEDPVGGTYVRDKDGKLTGQMLEPVVFLPMSMNATPMPTLTHVKEGMQKTWMEYSKAGFTTVCDLLYTPMEEIDGIIEEISAQDDCPIRVGIYTGDDPSQHNSHASCCDFIPKKAYNASSKSIRENEKLWVAGVKIICDGSPHCGTAATHEEYLVNDLTEALGFPAPPNNGLLSFTGDEEEKLKDRIVNYHRKGTQIAIHAHGERAIEQALDAFENVSYTSLFLFTYLQI